MPLKEIQSNIANVIENLSGREIAQFLRGLFLFAARPLLALIPALQAFTRL